MPVNLYEEAARRVKADKLADKLQCELITPDDVRLMDDREWGWAASEARVRIPVGPETRALVIEILEIRARR